MQRTQAPTSLLLVEDNDMLREELQHYLRNEGFDVRSADGGEAMSQALLERPADIFVLDLNMAGEDGISIAKRIRSSLPDARILMLTARVMSSDKLAGYESGADVYMTKPARPAELAAALRNLSARLPRQSVEKKWVLDTRLLRIYHQQKTSIELTGSEANLMKVLALGSGCVCNETLQVVLFKDQSVDGDTAKLRLEVLISRLRSKLTKHTGEVNLIKSVRGLGYQLCMDVEVH
jgi:DNA-binding response OmpR family regulator